MTLLYFVFMGLFDQIIGQTVNYATQNLYNSAAPINYVYVPLQIGIGIVSSTSQPFPRYFLDSLLKKILDYNQNQDLKKPIILRTGKGTLLNPTINSINTIIFSTCSAQTPFNQVDRQNLNSFLRSSDLGGGYLQNNYEISPSSTFSQQPFRNRIMFDPKKSSRIYLSQGVFSLQFIDSIKKAIDQFSKSPNSYFPKMVVVSRNGFLVQPNQGPYSQIFITTYNQLQSIYQSPSHNAAQIDNRFRQILTTLSRFGNTFIYQSNLKVGCMTRDYLGQCVYCPPGSFIVSDLTCTPSYISTTSAVYTSSYSTSSFFNYNWSFIQVYSSNGIYKLSQERLSSTNNYYPYQNFSPAIMSTTSVSLLNYQAKKTPLQLKNNSPVKSQKNMSKISSNKSFATQPKASNSTLNKQAPATTNIRTIVFQSPNQQQKDQWKKYCANCSRIKYFVSSKTNKTIKIQITCS